MKKIILLVLCLFMSVPAFGAEVDMQYGEKWQKLTGVNKTYLVIGFIWGQQFLCSDKQDKFCEALFSEDIATLVKNVIKNIDFAYSNPKYTSIFMEIVIMAALDLESGMFSHSEFFDSLDRMIEWAASKNNP